MRENQVGCSTVFKFAIHMVNVAPRMCSDTSVSFGNEISAITINKCIRRTCLHTGRFLSVVDTLRTEAALVNECAVDDALVVIEVGNPKRTGVHAIPATDAQVGIVSYGPIFRFGIRTNGTSRHTIGMVTVHAVVDHCAALQIGIFAFDTDTGNPDTSLIHRNIVFDAACDHAGAAVNTARSVEEKGVMFDFSHDSPLSLLDRHKGLAERLTTTNGIRVGHVDSRIACTDTISSLQTFGEMSITWRHVNAVGADGLSC